MDKEAGKIFVGGLSWQTNEESLRWHFEQYGPVLNVEVMRDRVTGDPRGFAFVTFTDAETVDIIMVSSIALFVVCTSPSTMKGLIVATHCTLLC